MSRLDKLFADMRNNPRGDWRIEQLKALAHRQHGTSHVAIRPPDGSKLTVPAHRPVKPAYIRRFLSMMDALRDEDGSRV